MSLALMRRSVGATTSLCFALFCGTALAAAPDQSAVLTNYANIAEAGYEDALTTAKVLDSAIDALLATPTEENLLAARQTWVSARVPYQQTEAYRFGNVIVDDWEGRVNAWPLDEGLIDYVSADYGTESDENGLYTANVIASPVIAVNGTEVDASVLSPAFLQDVLQEAGGIEANVATGYHAIEFLLWGQDTNYTGAGAGTRPASDFDNANCTGGNCDRRADYLKSASELLIADLEEMLANWGSEGKARTTLLADQGAGLSAILTGMGSLSFGELAGERMKLGLLLHDPEEEHDCFSDNTHASHLNDALGIQNVYLGAYTRIDGSVVSGPAISELVAAIAPDVDAELKARLVETMDAMQVLADRAETVEAYDQMIGEDNEAGNAVVQAAIDGLIAQTRSIERAVTILDLSNVSIEDSDSLSNPSAVFE